MKTRKIIRKITQICVQTNVKGRCVQVELWRITIVYDIQGGQKAVIQGVHNYQKFT